MLFILSIFLSLSPSLNIATKSSASCIESRCGIFQPDKYLNVEKIVAYEQTITRQAEEVDTYLCTILIHSRSS